MAEEPDPPPGRHHRGQAGVQLDGGVGVQETQTVGAHQPRPPATGQPDQALLAPDAFRTRFRESGGEHQEATGAFVQRPLGEGIHLGGGNGQDHQIRGLRQGCQGRIGLHAFDGLGPGVDRIDIALEASLEDVAENDAPHGGGIAGRAHHRHRPRPEERDEGVGRGHALADLRAFPLGLGGAQGEAHMDDAALHGPRGFEPRILEHVGHLLVFVEQLSLEAHVAGTRRQARQTFQDQRADAPALVRVPDHEGDFGDRPPIAHIVAEAQHLLLRTLTLDGEKAGPLMGALVAEILHELTGDAGHAAHEAHGHAFARETLDEGCHPFHVIRRGDPQKHALAILQQDEFPVTCAVRDDAEHRRPRGWGATRPPYHARSGCKFRRRFFLLLLVFFHPGRPVRGLLDC